MDLSILKVIGIILNSIVCNQYISTNIVKLMYTRCFMVLYIGVGRCFIVRGPNFFQLSQVYNWPWSDLRSLLCLLCCTKHAKVIGGLGVYPQEKF